MTIHLTRTGIYANTEQERLDFYDRLTTGDPSLMMELELYRIELSLVDNEDDP